MPSEHHIDITFMHLADAFIQSDLQCIQVIHFFQYVCSLGIEPTTFFALLMQCSTTEPQEHIGSAHRNSVANGLINVSVATIANRNYNWCRYLVYTGY